MWVNEYGTYSGADFWLAVDGTSPTERPNPNGDHYNRSVFDRWVPFDKGDLDKLKVELARILIANGR